MSEITKVLLEESEIPTQWYNTPGRYATFTTTLFKSINQKTRHPR